MWGSMFKFQKLTQGLTSCHCGRISGISKCQHEPLTLPNATCLKTCSSHFIPLVLALILDTILVQLPFQSFSFKASDSKPAHLKYMSHPCQHLQFTLLVIVRGSHEGRQNQISGWGIDRVKAGNHTLKTGAKSGFKWGTETRSGHLEQKGKEEGGNNTNKLSWCHNLPKVNLLQR